jgi:RNA polymerase sigma-70 factor (ECF subfamily)
MSLFRAVARNGWPVETEPEYGALVGGDKREKEWVVLMRAANAGDAAAYEKLLRQLAPVLRSAARRGLFQAGMSGADAEDIVQETLLAVHLKRQTWIADAPVGPWIRAIARHKIIDALRRRGRRVDLRLEDFSDVLASPDAEPDLVASDVNRHLDELPAGQRNVVRAIAVEGASIGEAAGRLAMSNGAVRVALHRGLAALAAKFRDGS